MKNSSIVQEEKSTLKCNRRLFLQWSCVSACTLVSPVTFSGNSRSQVTFHIAGVKYFSDNIFSSSEKLYRNQPLNLKKGLYLNQLSYSISTESGLQLGYVPAEISQRLSDSSVLDIRLQEIFPHQLPWKRYVTSIELVF